MNNPNEHDYPMQPLSPNAPPDDAPLFEEPTAMHPARAAYNRFRYEMADDLDTPRPVGFGGMNMKPDFVGSYMVKRMIEAQERQMGRQGN